MVTVTSTVPVPAGAVTVRLVAVITLIAVPAVAPKCDGRGPGEVGAGDRDRGARRPSGPLVGLTPVTVGAPGRCR